MSMQQEVVVGATAGSVSDAAIAAADSYSSDQIEEHAKALMEAWAARMKKHTDKYVKDATELARKVREGGVQLAAAGPVITTAPLYPWWEILIAGPFQPAPAPGGPYLPHKIFEADEPAFMLGAVWMNPAPINWFPPGPSAAGIMGAFDVTIRCETINLTNVGDGPDPAPVVMSPIGTWPLGPAWFKTFFVQIGNGFFPTPPSGQPHLYEMNVTADVTGPVPQPFAGYSTWVLDPDTEPPVFPPPILPGVGPQWQHDIPARFLVYQP
jgi:hypothetical protein